MLCVHALQADYAVRESLRPRESVSNPNGGESDGSVTPPAAKSQRGDGHGESGADADDVEMAAAGECSDDDEYDELIADAEKEYETSAPCDEPAAIRAVSQGAHQHPPPAVTATPALQLVADCKWRHVVVPDANFMPPIRGTKVPYTPPGASAAVEVDIEPVADGTISLASPWMGGGKTTAKREYQKDLIRESPTMRTLCIDCNRIYSASNAVNLNPSPP